MTRSGPAALSASARVGSACSTNATWMSSAGANRSTWRTSAVTVSVAPGYLLPCATASSVGPLKLHLAPAAADPAGH